MLRVVHIITSVKAGGAEYMLLRLLEQLQSEAYDAYVIGLSSEGDISSGLTELGIPVTALGSRPGVPNPSTLVEVARILRRFRPDVVQTWMYHADLAGALAARVAGNPPVVWGLHHSDLSSAFIKRATRGTARACALLSKTLPAAIVCCAESTRRMHAEIGYDDRKMVVIPNGFDLDRFKPDPVARAVIRAELGVDPHAPLIGMLARFHPQKDHRTFVRMAGEVARRRADVQFLLGGWALTWANAELVEWIDEEGIRDRIVLTGRRNDAAAVQASLDIACLTSQGGEALPLTIGEAMACGVPCVVTDVGDAAILVGKCGRVSAPRDAAGLATACLDILDLPSEERWRLGQVARHRIAESYSLPLTAARYLDLHERVARSELALAMAAE